MTGEIHVCAPRITSYLVRVRAIGRRKYDIAGERRTREEAYTLLANRMATGIWKRGDVLAQPESPYYEPSLCVEMVRA